MTQSHNRAVLPTPPGQRWPLWMVAIATAVVYARLCGCDFSWWDDFGTVHQNPWLNPPAFASLWHYWTSAAYGLYIPVTYTAWIGLALIGKLKHPDDQGISLNPWIFHSANVLVHVCAAVVVFAILRRLVKRDMPACLGALLFALHPVQVETVGWVSGLKDGLAGFLGLVAIWRYLIRDQRDPACSDLRPDVAGTIALILALLAKPSAAMVVPIVMTIDLLILHRPMRRVFAATALWLGLMLATMLVARWAQNVAGIPAAPLWARPLIVADALTFYLGKLIYPVWLGVDYGRRPDVVLLNSWIYFIWIIPAIIAAAMWFTRRRRSWLAAGGLIFVFAILPVSGLATFLFQFTSTTADHYLYLAMLGPALLLAFWLAEGRGRLAHGLVIAALVMLGLRSMAQTMVWRDDLTLFSNALQVNPRSFVAHNNLGHWYDMHGETENAIQEFRASIAINPNYAPALTNLASVLSTAGDVDGAIAALQSAIDIRARVHDENNRNAPADHTHMGQLLSAKGKYDEAIGHFQTALRFDPANEAALRSLKETEQKRAARLIWPASAAATTQSH